MDSTIELHDSPSVISLTAARRILCYLQLLRQAEVLAPAQNGYTLSDGCCNKNKTNSKKATTRSFELRCHRHPTHQTFIPSPPPRHLYLSSSPPAHLSFSLRPHRSPADEKHQLHPDLQLEPQNLNDHFSRLYRAYDVLDPPA